VGTVLRGDARQPGLMKGGAKTVGKGSKSDVERRTDRWLGEMEERDGGGG
jgi:hypothetical protein